MIRSPASAVGWDIRIVPPTLTVFNGWYASALSEVGRGVGAMLPSTRSSTSINPPQRMCFRPTLVLILMAESGRSLSDMSLDQSLVSSALSSRQALLPIS